MDREDPSDQRLLMAFCPLVVLIFLWCVVSLYCLLGHGQESGEDEPSENYKMDYLGQERYNDIQGVINRSNSFNSFFNTIHRLLRNLTCISQKRSATVSTQTENNPNVPVATGDINYTADVDNSSPFSGNLPQCGTDVSGSENDPAVEFTCNKNVSGTVPITTPNHEISSGENWKSTLADESESEDQGLSSESSQIDDESVLSGHIAPTSFTQTDTLQSEPTCKHETEVLAGQLAKSDEGQEHFEKDNTFVLQSTETKQSNTVESEGAESLLNEDATNKSPCSFETIDKNQSEVLFKPGETCINRETVAELIHDKDPNKNNKTNDTQVTAKQMPASNTEEGLKEDFDSCEDRCMEKSLSPSSSLSSLSAEALSCEDDKDDSTGHEQDIKLSREDVNGTSHDIQDKETSTSNKTLLDEKMLHNKTDKAASMLEEDLKMTGSQVLNPSTSHPPHPEFPLASRNVLVSKVRTSDVHEKEPLRESTTKTESQGYAKQQKIYSDPSPIHQQKAQELGFPNQMYSTCAKPFAHHEGETGFLPTGSAFFHRTTTREHQSINKMDGKKTPLLQTYKFDDKVWENEDNHPNNAIDAAGEDKVYKGNLEATENFKHETGKPEDDPAVDDGHDESSFQHTPLLDQTEKGKQAVNSEGLEDHADPDKGNVSNAESQVQSMEEIIEEKHRSSCEQSEDAEHVEETIKEDQHEQLMCSTNVTQSHKAYKKQTEPYLAAGDLTGSSGVVSSQEKQTSKTSQKKETNPPLKLDTNRDEDSNTLGHFSNHEPRELDERKPESHDNSARKNIRTRKWHYSL